VSPTPVWAGVVVSDLDRSVTWYTATLGCRVRERSRRLAVLGFSDGSTIELVLGDPTRPDSAFPSYHEDPGPPVMPGFAVDDPDELGRAFALASWLPQWVVAVGPQGLRVVLCDRSGSGRGLCGFQVASPVPDAHREWFASFGATIDAVEADELSVAPIVLGTADARHRDPDGTPVVVVGR